MIGCPAFEPNAFTPLIPSLKRGVTIETIRHGLGFVESREEGTKTITTSRWKVVGSEAIGGRNEPVRVLSASHFLQPMRLSA